MTSGEGAGEEPHSQPSPWLVPETIVDTAAGLTCDIEVGVAGSFAQLVGDDTLIDTSVLRPHSWEHQTVYIPVCQGGRGDRDTWLIRRTLCGLGLCQLKPGHVYITYCRERAKGKRTGQPPRGTCFCSQS